jgi:hypothetical protein
MAKYEVKVKSQKGGGSSTNTIIVEATSDILAANIALSKAKNSKSSSEREKYEYSIVSIKER